MYLPVLMVTGVITVILFWPLSPMLGVRSGPSIALVPIRSPIPVHTCTQTSVLITDGDRVERGRGGGSRRYIYIYILAIIITRGMLSGYEPTNPYDYY